MSPGTDRDVPEHPGCGDASTILTTHCQQLKIGEDNLCVAITPFSNRFFIIVSCYGKIGHLLDISRESMPFEASFNGQTGDSGDNDVISMERLLGVEDEDVEVAGRYIAEKIMTKSNGRVNSVLLGISLKNYGKATIKELTEKILATL